MSSRLKTGILQQLKKSGKEIPSTTVIYSNAPAEGFPFVCIRTEDKHYIQTNKVVDVAYTYRACRFTTKSGSVYLLAEDWSKEGE